MGIKFAANLFETKYPYTTVIVLAGGISTFLMLKNFGQDKRFEHLPINNWLSTSHSWNKKLHHDITRQATTVKNTFRTTEKIAPTWGYKS